MQLATLLIDQKEALTVFDIRSEEDIKEGSIPGSQMMKAEDLAKPEFWKNNLPPHHKYIIVTGDDTNLENLNVPIDYNVVFLEKGYQGWKNAILTKPENVIASKLTPEELKLRMALYSHFTGAALEAPKVTAPKLTIKPGGGKRKKKPSGGC